jgi:peptidoglycan hydrolase-like protein with peptidoglycan-binding domain
LARLASTLALLALLAVGCGGGEDESDSASGQKTASAQAAGEGTTAAEQPREGEERDGERALVYFTTGEQFRPTERPIEVAGDDVEPVVRELVEGPTPAEARADARAQTQIPDGTEVREVRVGDDGEAVVELSEEFMDGIPADPSRRSAAQEQELDARLGQVAYTVTQFDLVRSAKVVSGGGTVAPNVERRDYAKPAGGAPPVKKSTGSRDPKVRRVQKRLWRLGYLPRAGVDGLDGYRTRQAVMAFQSWEGLERDGIAGPITKAALAEARRPKPRPGGPPKRIEVFRSRGVALLVKEGRTKRAIHVSTGAPGTATPTGTYQVFRKERNSWSVPFSTWLPYASYFNNGIAFHEYPDVPPYPASHGCVRVPAPEAPFVYDFAAIGTTVRVH